MDQLFEAIRSGPLDAEHFRHLARQALNQAPPAGPFRRELTLALQQTPDWARIQRWPDIYRDLRSDESLIRAELYAYAAALTPAACDTTRMKRFCRTRAQPAALVKLRAQIEAAWEKYMNQPLQPQERTAETVAGHRLLVEGLAGWLEAIAQAEADPADPICLATAAQANRLLLAVSHQAHQLAGNRCSETDRG